jgi:hypothetical protein
MSRSMIRLLSVGSFALACAWWLSASVAQQPAPAVTAPAASSAPSPASILPAATTPAPATNPSPAAAPMVITPVADYILVAFDQAFPNEMNPTARKGTITALGAGIAWLGLGDRVLVRPSAGVSVGGGSSLLKSSDVLATFTGGPPAPSSSAIPPGRRGSDHVDH